MASDWPNTRLGEVAHLQRGLSYVAAQLRAPGRPFVTLKCFEKGGGFRRDGLKTFAGRAAPQYQLEGGELLIANTDLTRDASVVGAPAIAPRFDGEQAVFSMDVSRVVTDARRADNRFLAFRLATQDARSFMQARSGGSTVLHLQLRGVPKFQLQLPPLHEQRQIAAILETIDEAIRNTDAIIAKLRHVKQGLLNDLLTHGIDDDGELRDPERHPEQFKDSQIGRIPRGWEVSSLRDLAQGGLANGVFKEPSRAGRGCPLVNVGDLYAPFGINLDRVERFAATHAEVSRFAIKAGDIFFTRSSLVLAGIAACNIVREASVSAVYECHVVRLRPVVQRVVPEYLAHWCRAPFARSFLMGRAKQVTMTTIAQPDICPLPVPVPSLSEQRSLVSAVDAAELRIAEEIHVGAKLKLAKHGLMEDLLTGRVRVSAEVGA